MDQNEKFCLPVQELTDIEQLFPILDDTIEQICIDDNLNINDLTNNQFDYILMRLYRLVILPNLYLIKDGGSLSNKKYIKENVYRLYEWYLITSNKYNKAIRLKSFLYLTNINKGTMYSCNLGELLNDNNTYFTKKIREDSEQSLVNKMQDKGSNVVAYVSELNTRFGWNSVNGSNSNENKVRQTSLTSAKDLFTSFAIDEKEHIQLDINEPES